MKAIIFFTLLTVATLINGHALTSRNVQLIKNAVVAKRLARIFTLGVFSRMEAKTRLIIENGNSRAPILTPLPDPAYLADAHNVFPPDSDYAAFLFGTLSTCNSVATGTATVVDDLSITVALPPRVNYRLDAPAIHVAGGHDLDVNIFGDEFHLTASGDYTFDLNAFDLDLQLEIDLNILTGSFDISSASLDLNFESIAYFATNALGNDAPLDFAAFNAAIKQAFDTLWPQFKPEIDEIIKAVAAELTRNCNAYDMAAGDLSCIGTRKLSIEEMISAEIAKLIEIVASTCGTPAPTEPTLPPVESFLLYSENHTNHGDWADFIDTCPEGTYVHGFQVKNEGIQGPADDTSMNGLRLFCGNSGSAPSVVSTQGNFGDWGNQYFCENDGYVTGFQLRVEQEGVADDTAANNIRIYCSGNPLVPVEGDGNEYGEWRSILRCGSGYGVRGIKSQVESDQGIFSDDTALNNIALLCTLL